MGADLIPETDFCAPIFMTLDVSKVKECINADQAKCTGECNWYKGKDVADND
jgi:hypothetical protein